MSIRCILIVSLLALGTGLHARETGILIGNESFLWYETDSGGSRYLTESGTRQVIGLEGIDRDGNRERGLTLALYGGNVLYDGQLMDGTPHVSVTGYQGMLLEGLWRHHTLFDIESLFGEVSLGFEVWMRVLDQGGTTGYTETYQVLHSRLGLGYRFGGWYLKGGVKLPWSLVESVDLGLTLYPSPLATTYVELGVGRRDGIQLRVGMDGYSLQRSADVLFMGEYYHQPRSVQHSLLVTLYYPL